MQLILRCCPLFNRSPVPGPRQPVTFMLNAGPPGLEYTSRFAATVPMPTNVSVAQRQPPTHPQATVATIPDLDSSPSLQEVFSIPVRVYYEDTDAGGVVYYANYLKFMERARTELLRSRGFEQDDLIRDHGLVLAVRSVQVEFLLPARFNDLLRVSAKVSQCTGASMYFAQEVRREADATLLCSADTRIVSLDAKTFRPRPIPRFLSTEIASDH